MEGARHASLDQTVKSTYASRPRAASNRDVASSGTTDKQAEETQYPSTLPKVFQGMLKTTTETGDIGLFSIKPSRLPQLSSPGRKDLVYNENTRKPRQGFQPYGASGGDDRHRLPSYTRDASSEVISMYETASQKSGRKDHEDPDYRSYSMTQNSLLSYSLYAHRSYASLRSQPDGLGLIQRPRSPFAYHARLKRPGFRPSSPALTDDVIIDYSRRVGIERVPLGQNHTNSSPSSLYTQRRKPPLSIRNEANRSATCLLSQPSAPSCPPSPSHRHGTEIQGNDWQRRTFPASVKTSPARSVTSLASTVNVGGVRTPVFKITTPGKVPPPSPLYYDYTEDFDVDEYGQIEFRPPPPPAFRIDESIPEIPHCSGAERAAAIIKSQPLQTNVKSCVDNKPFTAFMSNKQSPAANGIIDTSITLCPIRSCDATAQEHQIPIGTAASKRDTSIIRLSGLGYGARQLSSHVEEVFGLPSSPSFEIQLQNSVNSGIEGLLTDAAGRDQVGNEFAAHPLRSFGPNLNIDRQGSLQVSDVSGSNDVSKSPDATETKNIVESNHRVCEPSQNLQTPESSIFIPGYEERSGGQLHHISSSQVGNVDEDDLKKSGSIRKVAKPITLTDKRDDEGQYLGWPQESATFHEAALVRSQATFTTLPNSTSDQNTHHGQPPPSHINSRINREILHKQHQQDDQQPILENNAVLKDLADTDLPNFNNKEPRQQLLSRSESPMLAPKPISPARQLRLKGSVPQLMKALPLPPSVPPARAELNRRQFSTSVQTDLSNNAPYSVPKNYRQRKRKQAIADKSRSQGQTEHKTALYSPDNSIGISPNLEKLRDRGMTVPVVPEIPFSSAQIPKLKLKGRHNTRNQQVSSSWSIDQEKRHPKSKLALDVQLSASDAMENPKVMKPKFKLKITRASNSTQGTIRIHRESAESKPLTGLHSRNMKDLFTPHSGTGNVFGRVGRHFQKGSITPSQSTRPLSVGMATSISSSIFWDSSESAATNQYINFRNTQRSRRKSSDSPAARSSFSDGLRNTKKRNKLRNKLSNWEFRIAVPYISRPPKDRCDGTQINLTAKSNDSNPSPLRSSPHVRSTEPNGRFRPVRSMMTSQQTQQMKFKIRTWLREARSTISGHVKLRSHVRKSDSETSQVAIGP